MDMKDLLDKIYEGAGMSAPDTQNLDPNTLNNAMSSFPSSSFDVGVSNTTVPMAGKIEGSEMPTSMPQLPPLPDVVKNFQWKNGLEKRYEVEDDATATPSPAAPVAAAPAPAPMSDKMPANNDVLSTNNDEAVRKAALAELEKRKKTNKLTEFGAGIGDAISASASAFGGNAPGGFQTRLTERHDKEQETGKKDIEMKLRNDANSDVSRQYQNLVAQFMQKDPKDPTILGLTANQIAEKLPAIEKIASMRQQEELKRAELENAKAIKMQTAADKAKGQSEDLWTPLGQAKTKNDAKLIKDAHASYLDSKMGVQELIDLRKKKGAEFLDRESVAKGKMAAANLLLQYKTLVKLGVLSKDDYRLLDRIVPQDPLQVDIMEDTPAKLAQFDKEVDRKMDSFARSYGVQSPAKPEAEEKSSRPKAGQRKTKSGITFSVDDNG